MTALETYQTRFDDSAWQVFRRMLQRARSVGHAELSDSHLLGALIEAEAEVFAGFFQQIGVDPVAFRAALDQQINDGNATEGEPVRLDPSLVDLLQWAWNRARANGRERIDITDLLATSAQNSESSLVRLLESLGSDLNHIAAAMLVCIEQRGKEVMTSSSQVELPEEALREGDVVRILSGPFSTFSGRVREVNPSRSTVIVSVDVLRKLQTVELLFSQVQKLQFG